MLPFSTDDATQIFLDAARLNMTGEGYVWIVTEQALRSRNVPSGTLGLQLVGAEDERGHISDSLYVSSFRLLYTYSQQSLSLMLTYALYSAPLRSSSSFS